MCSSPKSSGNAKPSNISVRGVFGGVSQSSRERFASVANAAQERREQAKIHSKTKQTKARTLNQGSPKDGSKSSKPNSGDSLFWIFKTDLLSLFAK